MNFKTFKKGVVLGVTILAICALSVPSALAQVAQTPLPGNKIPQFAHLLPDLTSGLDVISAGGAQIVLYADEFKTNVLPPGAVAGYTGTWVWGYVSAPTSVKESFIGPVIIATYDNPTEIKWVNNLGYADPYGTGAFPSAQTSQLLAYTQSTDQTMHWANPLEVDPPCMDRTAAGQAPTGVCAEFYAGTIPDVTHLHGGEVPAEIDGGPDAWYTSNGNAIGPAYYSKDGLAAKNYSIFRYPNKQEEALIWFHPHPLGVTRLNVYAGLAGAYLIDGPGTPADLPPPIPLVIQDRMFDVNGQLYFPNIGINPEHPYWIPEFVGDTIVVNGKVWPFTNVNRQRYNLLFLDGSNARFYDTFFIDPATGVKGPRMWVIATDGGYLDSPVEINPNATGRQTKAGIAKSLVFGPGERYMVIVDFNDPIWIANLTTANGGVLPATVNLQLRNTARTPFPGGAPAPKSTTGRIMQFRVNLTNYPPPGTPPEDLSYNPATDGPLRTGTNQIVRLVDPVAGTLAVTAQVTRQLTLNEVMGPGGPLEVLVNNTKWNGKRPDGTPLPGSTDDGIGNYVTETPTEGQTEVWEIVNITADAHPIHLHLVQFQLINRQPFDAGGYTAAYDAVFPAGVFTPAYGPPYDYDNSNNPDFTTQTNPPTVGGNPDVGPFLNARKWPARPPLPQEAGWKDTVIMYPGEVTRIAVRWAPQDLPNNTPEANAYFAFDPSGQDYVWHCHILDHEDNEMMRPTLVTPNGSANRTYTDY